MRFLWAAALIPIGALTAVGHARACGASPPAYWTLSGALPASGQTIPTDGAVLLIGKAWADVYPNRSGEELINDGLAVSVRDAADALVAGKLETWWYGGDAVVAWRPTSPLPASSSFRLEATARSSTARPAGVVGDTVLRTDFATGPGPAAALRLAGDVAVRLETYQAELFKNCNNCGTGCTPNGSVRALRARVTLPATEGGFAPDGYLAWVWMTNDRPHDLPDGRGGTLVNLGGVCHLEPGKPAEVLLSVPGEEQPYSPCITTRIFDPAGHFTDPPPLCLPRIDVNETIRMLDGAPATSPPPTPSEGGCAVAPSTSASAGLPGALLLLLIVAVVVRVGRARSERGSSRRKRGMMARC
jgi:hypothetical protein